MRATRTTREMLRNLPTPARQIVDPSDVEVPEGYEVEAVLVGLSVPTGMGFAEDGTLFVLEGGATWPTRPGLIPRILKLDPSGGLEVFATESFGGPRGVVAKDGYLYVSLKGGYNSRVVRYDLATREREVLVDQLPQGGWHEPGGPIFGPDGLMYFGQGSVSLNGVVEPAGFQVDIAKHPNAHDVPGQDVTLTGNNVWTYDPTSSYPYYAETGAFKPYGVPAQKGEVVKGELFCNTCIMRSQPDGTEPELLAWGVRNPWGMAFSEDGGLYVADLCMEEKGARPVGEDPGRIWHIDKAREPYGSVDTPDWYGFPDYCGDGLPVWHEKHRAELGPITGRHPEPLIEDPPPLAGPAAYLNEPHTGNGKIEFCPSDAFGYRGKLFLTQFGTYYPLNTMREDRANKGFNVVAIDLDNPGEPEIFMKNRVVGPASAHPGNGGLERPVDVKFSPDGQSMYVLDFGLHAITKRYIWAYGHTGVLWRVNRQGEREENGMSLAKNTSPIVVELDEAGWKEKVDRAETWFGNVLTVQGAFRRLAHDTREKVQEPHIRDYLGEILEKATEHERQAEELFGMIGREAPASRKLAGPLVAGAHKALGKVEGTAGGATDAWQDLRQLILLNIDSMGAFATAEQIGFALAMPEVSKITFDIENQKMKHHLIMQELLLETAAISILFRRPI